MISNRHTSSADYFTPYYVTILHCLSGQMQYATTVNILAVGRFISRCF